ncbi:hypothetical protein KM043_018121 [Ampulex compressa]|nr:hypothetical protein KM043_018121 [Ampulex compressa]
MTQILRTRRSDISLLLWSYRNQRRQLNYYEILRVPKNSSQKEIKQAFVKLSKKMHPDTSGKESHADFVKLNEAYSVLSKERTRKLYDENLKYYGMDYNSPRSNIHYHHYYENVYTSRAQWEARMSSRPWSSPKSQPYNIDGLYLCFIIMVVGISVQKKNIKNYHNNRVLKNSDVVHLWLYLKLFANNILVVIPPNYDA